MSYPRLAHALLNGRPYFGAAMRALQGDPARHQYFLPVVRRLAESQSPPLTILEVGSWAGASAVSWAKALEAAPCEGTLTCVDTWSPYFDLMLETAKIYTDMDEVVRTGDIFRLFLHNIRACGVEGLIRHRVGDSREVLRDLPAESFDLVYVDGAHRCDVVRSDLAHAKRLLRPDGILCGDDLELQRVAVDPDEHLAGVAQGVDYIFSRKAGAYYHPGVTEAVVLEIGDVSAWNGFWAVQKRVTGWRGVDLDLRNARIPDHIRAAVEVEGIDVVGETESFNLVRTGTRYLALAKSLGPTEPLVERLGERDLGPLVFVGASLGEVQSKTAQAEIAGPKEASTSPELMGEYSGFNLVRYGDKAYGLRLALAQVDVLIGDPALRERYGFEDVIIADSVESVMARIDFQRMERVLGELAARIATGAQQIATHQQVADRQERRVSELAAQVATGAEQIAIQREVVQRQEEMLTELTAHLAAGAQQIATQQRIVHRQEERLRELTARLAVIEFGPAGDPATVQLVGSHREFNLVRYGGKAYGLRQGVGPVDVSIGDVALRESYGPEDVIIAASVEGVTARIDAQRVEQAVREISARLETLDVLVRRRRGRLAKSIRRALRLHVED